MTNFSKREIIVSSHQSIAKYSSKIIKQGLELAKKINKIGYDNLQNEDRQWKCIYKFKLPEFQYEQIKINSSGDLIATVDKWGIINIWCIEDGNLLYSLDCGYLQKPSPDDFFYETSLFFYEIYKKEGGNYSIEFISNSEKIIGINYKNREIMIWNYKTGTLIENIKHSCDILDAVNSQIIVTIQDWDRECTLTKILNLDSATEKDIVLSTNYFDVEHTYLSLDAQLLAISGNTILDHGLSGRDNNTEEEWWLYENSIKIIDLQTGTLLYTLDIYVYRFTESEESRSYDTPLIKINKNKKFLISIDTYINQSVIDEYEERYEFKIWDLEFGNILYTSQAFDYLDIDMLEINTDGKLIKYDDDTCSVQVIDIYNPQKSYLIKGNIANDFLNKLYADSNENTLLILDDEYKTLELWNLQTGNCVQTISVNIPDIILLHSNLDTNIFIGKNISKKLVIEAWRIFCANDAITHKNIDLNIEKMIKELITIGNERYNVYNYDGAIDAYTKVLSFDPNNADAYNRRSTARSALGDVQGALEDLQKVRQSLNF